MLTGLNLKALVIAWAIDIIGSTVIGFAALVVVIVSKQLGVDDLADQAALTRLIYGPEVLVPSFAVGCVFSLVAGYVAARIAGTRELVHGLASSAASVAVTLGSIRQMVEFLPTAVIVGGIVLSIGFGCVGGWLRLATKRSEVAAS